MINPILIPPIINNVFDFGGVGPGGDGVGGGCGCGRSTICHF